jgi:hypothetical protein
MIDTVPGPLEELFDRLGSKVKRMIKRARKRWRKRRAPKKRAAKPRKKRVPKPAVYADNVVPFPRRYRRR